MITPSIVRAARSRLDPEPGEGEPDEVERAHATSRPSRTWTWRSAPAATSASWVMRTIVRPVAWSSRRMPDDLGAAGVSRLPVGSSARSSAGSVTRARAIADPLLLAAGQLGRLVVEPVAEAEALERRAARGVALARARRPGRRAASPRSRARVVRGSRL